MRRQRNKKKPVTAAGAAGSDENRKDIAQAAKAIYYDASNPAGFGGLSRIAKALTVKDQHRVRKWLQSQRVYTLHKPVRKRYDTRVYKVGGIDFQWQADLCEMQQHASLNNGMRYILTVIDIFSRYAWAEPIAAKSGQNIVNAFRKIFQKSGRKPLKLQTDQGKEFENATFRSFLREQGNIKHFTVKSQFKAAIVERYNRTLKEKLWRYFTYTGSYRWLEVLPLLVQAYNSANHRTIGMAPKNVNAENEHRIWLAQEQRGPIKATQVNPVAPWIKVGDYVRLSKVKRHFDKGYLPNFTEEVFKVTQVIKKHGKPTQYKVTDYNGHELEGAFYAAEIQKIEQPSTYMIETILGKRKAAGGRKGNSMEYLVKWLGYGPEFNSWERLDPTIANNILNA
jgi:Integrase core domain/Chromo (CHRromatin Organisation MOdifier) domain